MGGLIDEWATQIAKAELSSTLPRRWAHTQGVAKRAVEVGQALGQDASLLVAAATLHDIGYAPRLAATGFHPLDGARFLRDEHGADERLGGAGREPLLNENRPAASTRPNESAEVRPSTSGKRTGRHRGQSRLFRRS